MGEACPSPVGLRCSGVDEGVASVLLVPRMTSWLTPVMEHILWGGMLVSAALSLMSFAEAFLDLCRFVPRLPGMGLTGRAVLI